MLGQLVAKADSMTSDLLCFHILLPPNLPPFKKKNFYTNNCSCWMFRCLIVPCIFYHCLSHQVVDFGKDGAHKTYLVHYAGWNTRFVLVSNNNFLYGLK